MASAYMAQSNISCSAYMAKLERMERGGHGSTSFLTPRQMQRQAQRQSLEDSASSGYMSSESRLPLPAGVAQSLSLSLHRIADATDGDAARAALDSLCFLAPESITRPLLRELLLLRLESRQVFANGALRLQQGGATAVWNKHVSFSLSVFEVGTLAFGAIAVVAAAAAAGAAHARQSLAHSTPSSAATTTTISSSSSSSSVVLVSSVALMSAVLGGIVAHNAGHRKPRRRSFQYNKPSQRLRQKMRTTIVNGLRSDLSYGSVESDVALVAYRDHGRVQITADESGDRVWRLLREFCLITVDAGKGKGSSRTRNVSVGGDQSKALLGTASDEAIVTASMHRLLQQLLRCTQGRAQALGSMRRCSLALRNLWKFDPADTLTWPHSRALLEHIARLGRHVASLLAACTGTSTAGDSTVAGEDCIDDDDADECDYDDGGGAGFPREVPLCTETSLLLTEAALYESMALSQFDEAAASLATAVRLQRFATAALDKGDRSILSSSPWIARLRDAQGATFLTRGKVSRYRGRLGEAEDALQAALALWSEEESDSWEIAATLHELGVLCLKQGRSGQAGERLEESLAMKRRVKANATDDRGLARKFILRFANESATLHQLAAVKLASGDRSAHGKEKRLAEAESLLKQALAIESEGGNPFGPGAKAATLQQLSRVAVRRGKLVVADQRLREALELHRSACELRGPLSLGGEVRSNKKQSLQRLTDASPTCRRATSTTRKRSVVPVPARNNGGASSENQGGERVCCRGATHTAQAPLADRDCICACNVWSH